MSELTSLRNIGKELDRKLRSINISTVDELKAVGSEEAFIRMKMLYPNICLVHLYSLEGAILDIDYNQLPDDVKKKLKEINNRWE